MSSSIAPVTNTVITIQKYVCSVMMMEISLRLSRSTVQGALCYRNGWSQQEGGGGYAPTQYSHYPAVEQTLSEQFNQKLQRPICKPADCNKNEVEMETAFSVERKLFWTEQTSRNSS